MLLLMLQQWQPTICALPSEQLSQPTASLPTSGGVCSSCYAAYSCCCVSSTLSDLLSVPVSVATCCHLVVLLIHSYVAIVKCTNVDGAADCLLF
jgi:hypothetical protein